MDPETVQRPEARVVGVWDSAAGGKWKKGGVFDLKDREVEKEPNADRFSHGFIV